MSTSNFLYNNDELKNLVNEYMFFTQMHQYSKAIHWLGIQSMQYPEDLFALQDIVWENKPDCIIATGVAMGGTLLFLNSIMNCYDDSPLIIGVDPYISLETESTLSKHSACKGIYMLKKSSIEASTVKLAEELIDKFNKKR